MSRRDNPVKTYLSDEEDAKLERWATETGKSKSELLRDAVMEYTDLDRYERIENDLGQLDDKVDRILSLVDGERTHTSGGSGTQSVPEKARSIARRIYENHEIPVQSDDVELAIEDIAGGDERTVRKYKEQLKKRGLLYEHPTSAVWTDDKETYVSWVESAHHNPDIHEVTQEYGMGTTEYTKIAEEIEQ